MNSPALAAGGVAALANVAGAAMVTIRARWSSSVLALLVALAAGFMLGAVLSDLLPNAIRRGGDSAAAVALGAYLLVYVMQHALPGHIHFSEQPGHVEQHRIAIGDRRGWCCIPFSMASRSPAGFR